SHGRNLRIDLGESLFQPFKEQYIRVLCPLRKKLAWGNIGTVKNRVAEALKDFEGGLFNSGFSELGGHSFHLIICQWEVLKQSEKTHVTPSTVASKSFTRISPEISSGKSKSRMLVKVRDWRLTMRI